MIYTELTKKAMKICYDAHKDQMDDSGVPYVFHPLHLAENMETEYETCAALLHDVPEDTDWTVDDLEKAGFPREITEAVSRLTHRQNQPYMEYVLSVRDNALASKVKLMDLAHNSDCTRLNQIRPYDMMRLRKYRIARALLEETGTDPDSGASYRDLPLHNEHPWFLRVLYPEESNGEENKGEKSSGMKGQLIRGDAVAFTVKLDEDIYEKGCMKAGKRISFPERIAHFLAEHPWEELGGWFEEIGIFCE